MPTSLPTLVPTLVPTSGPLTAPFFASISVPRAVPRLVRAALISAVLSLGGAQAGADEVTVFAAASLKNALRDIGAAWTAQTGHTAVFSFAGTSALARQIQQGAPADVFISANSDWMDALIASNDVLAASRRNILGNALVLIAHDPQTLPAQMNSSLDLLGMLAEGRLAMALIDAVPAGIYGREALVTLGLWGSVQDRIAQAENVSSAVQFVAAGEAPLGIVYATDAKGASGVSVIGVFPASSHTPIVYPAAITAISASAASGLFIAFLTSSAATAIWVDAGFTVIR